ncbi:MAG: cytochrome c oxidase subunit II [Methylomonas sp.]
MNPYKFGFHPGVVGNYMVFLLVLAAEPVILLEEQQISPLDYFMHSYGPATSPIMHMGWVFVGLLITIFIIILSLLLMAVFRKRPTKAPSLPDREEAGMSWIYVGTGLSICILFGLAIYSLLTLNAIAKPAQAPSLTLTVTGYDWWWKVEYEDDDPNLRIETANEIHIPVGQPVLVKLKSKDVIHAFWVPTLAGKTQMIPGLTNQQWLQADKEGVYRGQCTQFCGVQHAHMGFEVVAHTEADFHEWQAAQRKAAGPVSESHTKAGNAVFQEHCAGCHAVRGTAAAGTLAPDLTHLKSRRQIAAGLLTNTPEHLQHWISHAQDLKPGSQMPSMVLTPTELSALSAYLSTLD